MKKRCNIHVNVLNKHKEPLVRENWNVFGMFDDYTIFTFECLNRYKGDDETVVRYLWENLPEDFNPKYATIDWDGSVY